MNCFCLPFFNIHSFVDLQETKPLIPKSSVIKVMPEHIAVTRFREYLRIKTVQPSPDYKASTRFFKSYAAELGLDFDVIEIVAGKPIVVLTWKGSKPELSAVMLNSHVDVVPVSESDWKYPPFDAVKDSQGNIYGRGAQDMKCVAIAYLESIRMLKSVNFVPSRSIHVTLVPDEEIGGDDGMRVWLPTVHFKALDIGFALDEGQANADDSYRVYYGERAPWWIKITAKGNAGHGSQFIEPSATGRLIKVLDKFVQFRDAEQMRMLNGINAEGRPLTLGDVTTTNVTLINTGHQFNVVPEIATAGVDMRVSPLVNFNALERTIRSWCDEHEAELEFQQQCLINATTPLTKDNPWWCAIQQVAATKNVSLVPEIFPAATDSRYLREAGIPAIGISPIRNTPVLLHDHNEFLNETCLLEMVDFYVKLLPSILVI